MTLHMCTCCVLWMVTVPMIRSGFVLFAAQTTQKQMMMILFYLFNLSNMERITSIHGYGRKSLTVREKDRTKSIVWGNRFTKRMLPFLPDDEYGKRYCDVLIKEWEEFVFRKENPKKRKKKANDDNDDNDDDDDDDNDDDDDDNDDDVCFDLESTYTTSEKVCQRIEDDTQALPENNSDGVVDIDSAKAVDIHFTSKDPRFALKRNLIDECKRLGIQYMKEDKSGPLIVKDIWSNVEVFFSKLHKRDQTGAHDSKCFMKERQKIDRERKGTTAMQRAAAYASANRRKKKKPKTKPT